MDLWNLLPPVLAIFEAAWYHLKLKTWAVKAPKSREPDAGSWSVRIPERIFLTAGDSERRDMTSDPQANMLLRRCSLSFWEMWLG